MCGRGGGGLGAHAGQCLESTPMTTVLRLEKEYIWGPVCSGSKRDENEESRRRKDADAHFLGWILLLTEGVWNEERNNPQGFDSFSCIF